MSTDPNAKDPICDACHDDGQAPCDACEASPDPVCPACDGTGYVTCRCCPTCHHCGGLLRESSHRRCWRIDHD